MTVQAYCNGFEGGIRGTWQGRTASAVTADAAAARTGSYGCKLAPAAQTNMYIERQTTPAGLEVAVGRCYFKFTSFPIADAVFMTFWDSGSKFYGLRYLVADDSLSVYMYDGTSELYNTSGPVLSLDTWYRLDWRMYGGNSANGKQFDWQIDGAAQTSTTVDSTGPIGLHMWRLGQTSTQTYTLYVDDCVYAWTDDDPDYTSVKDIYPIGEGWVKGIHPDGVGTHVNDTSFTTSAGTIADSWQLISDTDNASYIAQTTIGDTDYLEYTLGDHEAADEKYSVQAVTAMGITDSSGLSANNAGEHLIDGARDVEIYDGSWIQSSPSGRMAILTDGTYGWSLIPGNTTAWTHDRVDALKYRWGYSSDVVSAPWNVKAWMEVAYGLPLTGGDHWAWSEESLDSWQEVD